MTSASPTADPATYRTLTASTRRSRTIRARASAGPTATPTSRAVGSALPVIEDDVILDAAGVVAVGWLVYLMWRGARRDQWPLESKVLASVLWLIPICSRLIGGQLRYMLGCWPALLVVAEAWPRLSPRLRVAGVAATVGVGVLLLHHVASGVYTG